MTLLEQSAVCVLAALFLVAGWFFAGAIRNLRLYRKVIMLFLSISFIIGISFLLGEIMGVKP